MKSQYKNQVKTIYYVKHEVENTKSMENFASGAF